MKVGSREYADRLLLDLIELRRAEGEAVVLAQLADDPLAEGRAVAAVNRLVGVNWRWAWPRWRRIAEYIALAVDGWPLTDRPTVPIAAPKRSPRKPAPVAKVVPIRRPLPSLAPQPQPPTRPGDLPSPGGDLTAWRRERRQERRATP